MTRIGSSQVGGMAGVSQVQVDNKSDSIDQGVCSVQFQRIAMIEDQVRKDTEAYKIKLDAAKTMATTKADLESLKAAFSENAKSKDLIDQPSNMDQSTALQVKNFNEAYGKDPDRALADAQTGAFGTAYTRMADVALSARSAGLDDTTVDKIAKGKITATELETIIGHLDAKIESAAGTQQIDMLKLQSLLAKQQEAYQMISNIVKKLSDTASSILSNLR